MVGEADAHRPLVPRGPAQTSLNILDMNVPDTFTFRLCQIQEYKNNLGHIKDSAPDWRIEVIQHLVELKDNIISPSPN